MCAAADSRADWTTRRGEPAYSTGYKYAPTMYMLWSVLGSLLLSVYT